MAGAAATQKPIRKMERVMPLLLELEKANHDYQPLAVSFGPYHHGEKKLALVEAFKPTAVKLFTSGGEESKEFYRNKILEIIDELRSCYVETSLADYTDAYLAQMLLNDAALLIIFMEVAVTNAKEKPGKLVLEKHRTMVAHLGMLTYGILSRDMVLFDNQIPLRVIRVLVDSRDGVAGRGDELVYRFLILDIFGEHVNEASKHKVGDPLHLLQVIRSLHINGSGKPKPKVEEAKTDPSPTNCCIFKCRCCSIEIDLENNLGVGKLLGCKSVGSGDKDSLKRFVPTFRAATDLKAKGIYFKPSPTQSLEDVTFKYHILYARLRIPWFTVSKSTKVLFKNMIAYELSPSSRGPCKIASFINFVKSLIEKAEDVKELREKRILYNMLGSDEEAFNLLKDIDTHGADVGPVYQDVRNEIAAHCNSKMKTWTAELIHTNFSSPWTMTAFLATVVLLAITVAQLYYAVYPN